MYKYRFIKYIQVHHIHLLSYEQCSKSMFILCIVKSSFFSFFNQTHDLIHIAAYFTRQIKIKEIFLIKFFLFYLYCTSNIRWIAYSITIEIKKEKQKKRKTEKKNKKEKKDKKEKKLFN